MWTIKGLAILLFCQNIWAQNSSTQYLQAHQSQTQPKKILLMGDSWASFMILEDSFARAFEENHICYRKESDKWNLRQPEGGPLLPRCYDPAYEIYDNQGLNVRDTAIWGMKARSWFEHSVSRKSQKILRSYKPDIVYLSIGGNDFFNDFISGQSPAQILKNSYRIKNDVLKIITLIQSEVPGVQIILSGYDFVRFHSGDIHSAYQNMYEEMGSPSAKEMFEAFMKLSETLSQLASPEKGVFYIQHFGVMHYHFGSEEDPDYFNLPHPPYQSLPIEQISPPEFPNQTGGYLSAWQRPKAMLQLFGMRDAFHPSRTGFKWIADHTIKIYLEPWIKGRKLSKADLSSSKNL